MQSQETIADLVRKVEEDYISGTTTFSRHVSFSLKENIEKIDAYLNSKHISGGTDSMGREKPFFNIVTAAVNIWYRATDLDRKNIRFKANRPTQVVPSFLATAKMQEWMKRANFGAFLNEWGRSLARYGSSVVKFVERDGELHSMVIPWNRLIVDAVDFENNVVIEVLELTPAQLRQRDGYDQDIVENLIDTKSSRETLGKEKKDNKNEYIKLYEVHGNLPLSFITGDEKDEKTYVQQMHVVSFVANKKINGSDYDDFTLVKGREKKSPYMVTHLIKEDGRTLSIGAVEHLFEAQWMVNHTAKQMKDQLDLASKLIFQTADTNFVGQNALQSIENGDILIHSINTPLTQVENASHDITSLQNFNQMWKTLSQEQVSTPDSVMGNAAPSGTAWRQVEALQGEAHSLFEIMTENKGLAIEEMCRHFIIPHLKKQLDTKDEIVATLDDYGIKQIEQIYVKAEATRRTNDKFKAQLIAGEVPEAIDPATAEQEVSGELSNTGTMRYFVPSDFDDMSWAEVFKEFEWEADVEVTNENVDKEATVTTLTTVLQTIAANPMILENPTAKMVFNQILEETGRISPLQIASTPIKAPTPQQAEALPEQQPAPQFA